VGDEVGVLMKLAAAYLAGKPRGDDLRAEFGELMRRLRGIEAKPHSLPSNRAGRPETAQPSLLYVSGSTVLKAWEADTIAA
jgi:hypothetical protein